MPDNIIKTPSQLMSADDTQTISADNVNHSAIGKMLFFNYDPKYKHTLPYYDQWPLIFPIDVSRDYMIGLNFHYLPLYARLIVIQNFNKYLLNTKKTSLDISYRKISENNIKFKYTKSMLKKYLFDHIRTQIVLVPNQKWNLILVAPLDRFKKAENTRVWRDTISAEQHHKKRKNK